jgi:hypothetical protein
MSTQPAHAPAEHESFVQRLLSLVPFIGVIGFAIAAIAHFATDGTTDWQRWAVENAVFWFVGIGAFILGSGHILMADKVAENIGWPKGNPFQFEVGLASLSYGTLGVFATSKGPEWWLAAIVAFSVFMLGAAAGHVVQMVKHRNFAPGNAGVIFWYDILVPLFLIALYVLYEAS